MTTHPPKPKRHLRWTWIVLGLVLGGVAGFAQLALQGGPEMGGVPAGDVAAHRIGAYAGAVTGMALIGGLIGLTAAVIKSRAQT